MTIATYSDLQTQITNWLGGRTDLTSFYADWITLFEAMAARRLRARLQETTTILVFPKQTAQTITNAANNGSGLIRLTMASTSSFTTGQPAVVQNVGGTTEANAEWIVTVNNSTTLDLQGSTFTNTYTSGGTVIALQGRVSLPSDYISVRRATWTGDPRSELLYVHPTMFQSFYPKLQINASPIITPQSYTIEDSKMIISAAAPGTVELVYYAKTAALSGTLNWLFSNYPDIYLFGALAEAGGFVVDDAALMRWSARRDAIFDEIRLVDFKERPSSMAARPLAYTP